MTNTTVSYPTNIMPLICDCKNLMDRDWVVQVQPIYCEANACANALAKRGTHQQNLLSVYNSCPSFVYMYYVPVWIRLIVFWVSHFLLLFFFFFLSFFSAYEQSTWFMHMDSLGRRQSTLFMHCSRTVYRTHNYFIQKKNIKNESHDTIYTFKIYLVTMFLIFSKINYIQTNLRVLESQLCVHGPAVSAV